MISLNQLLEGVEINFGDDMDISIEGFGNVLNPDDEDYAPTGRVDLKEYQLKRILKDDKMNFTKIRNQMTAVPDTNENILKKVLEAGHGAEITKLGYYKVHYVAFHSLSKIPYDATRARHHHPLSVHTNELEDQWLKGYAAAIRTMRVGEKSIFWIHSKLCFGEYGCMPRVPKNAAICLYVELIEFNEAKLEVAPEEEITQFIVEMGRAKDLYNAGTSCYERKDYRSAASNLRRVIDILTEISLANDLEEKQMKEVLCMSYLGLIKVYDRSESYKKVCAECRVARILAPEIEKDYKYWLIRGRACRMLAFDDIAYNEAKNYLEKALQLEPEKAYIMDELNKLSKSQQAFKSAASESSLPTLKNSTTTKENLKLSTDDSISISVSPAACKENSTSESLILTPESPASCKENSTSESLILTPESLYHE